MNPEKLYNVTSLDEWEDLFDRANDPDYRTVIVILADYLRWAPKGYRPKSTRAWFSRHVIETVTHRPLLPASIFDMLGKPLMARP